jgi:hypothetical protein
MTEALNVTSTPVVIDNQGHTLPGGERGEVDEGQWHAQHHVLLGHLRLTVHNAVEKVEDRIRGEADPVPDDDTAPFGHLPADSEHTAEPAADPSPGAGAAAAPVEVA